MKINIINLIDISLVLVLSYILILRGKMSNLCLKGFVVGIVVYHIISKHYNIEKFFLDVKIPEKFEFVGKLINGKPLKIQQSKKIEKVEKFLQSKISNKKFSSVTESILNSENVREPVQITESFSEF